MSRQRRNGGLIQQVKRVKIDDIDAEKKRYEDAKTKAVLQLRELHQKAVKEVGEMNAEVFDVHAMMVEDGDYVDSILNIIETQQFKWIRRNCLRL